MPWPSISWSVSVLNPPMMCSARLTPATVTTPWWRPLWGAVLVASRSNESVCLCRSLPPSPPSLSSVSCQASSGARACGLESDVGAGSAFSRVGSWQHTALPVPRQASTSTRLGGEPKSCLRSAAVSWISTVARCAQVRHVCQNCRTGTATPVI